MSLTIGEKPQETNDLLCLVLGQDSKATAALLVDGIHSQVPVPFQFQNESTAAKLKGLNLKLENLGIWIDPIGKYNIQSTLAYPTLVDLASLIIQPTLCIGTLQYRTVYCSV